MLSKLLIPQPSGEWSSWIQNFWTYWQGWSDEVATEIQRTQDVVQTHGVVMTLLTGTQAAALVTKRTDTLYACSSDPSGGGGGSGWYRYDGTNWIKF